jgi:hypothetical protein
VDGEGKLILVTRDGSVWASRERDSTLQPPKAGTEAVIKASFPGLYDCRVGKWMDFLCTRVK